MPPIHSTPCLGFLTISPVLPHLLLHPPFPISPLFHLIPLPSSSFFIACLSCPLLTPYHPLAMHPTPYSPFSFNLTRRPFFYSTFLHLAHGPFLPPHHILYPSFLSNTPYSFATHPTHNSPSHLSPCHPCCFIFYYIFFGATLPQLIPHLRLQPIGDRVDGGWCQNHISVNRVRQGYSEQPLMQSYS